MNFKNVFSLILLCSLLFAPFSYGQSNYASASHGSTLEMKPMTDSRTGRVNYYLPLPANWRVVSSGSGMQGIEGPNGINVTFMPNETYYYNIDPYVAQMSGKAVSNPIPLETIFQQNIVPAIQQQGGRLLKQYALPQIAKRNHQLLQQSSTRSRLQNYNILASEWQQPNGHKSLILITQGIMQSQAGNNWWISLTEMEAPSGSFDQAKETFLYAQANWQPDQRTATAHLADLRRIDRDSEQRIAASRAAHNRKMREREAAFQAGQRTHTETYGEISDMSMRGYWSRSEMQDGMRNKEVNMIHQENTMTNPWDNHPLQVQSGYNTYYINAQGDVIGSNDANFNPNVHSNYNHTEWRQMPRQ